MAAPCTHPLHYTAQNGPDMQRRDERTRPNGCLDWQTTYGKISHAGGCGGEMRLRGRAVEGGDGMAGDANGRDAPSGSGAAGHARKKVLVVDDSRLIVDLVRRAIEQLRDSDVVVAYDGVQGLQQYQRERPDCVVVDVMMPNMDGFQFARALRGDSTSSQTPLVIITTLASDDKRLTGLLSGADEYLTKPFKPAELCDALERVMAITPEERERRIKELASGALGRHNTSGDDPVC